LVPHRGGQVVRAHHRRELAEPRRARDDPTALEGPGIAVQQRQTLADEHLAPPPLTPAQTLARAQPEEVAVGAIRDVATEAPVKHLKHGRRREDERVPRPVVAIDVPSTSQREVHVGEVLVEDRLADLRNSSPLHQASSSCDSCHCSIASWASMRTHGRSRSATGRRSWARTWAIRPAIRKCSDSGTPSVKRAVISERSWTPRSDSARTRAANTSNGSTEASTASGSCSRSARGRRTGGGRSGGLTGRSCR